MKLELKHLAGYLPYGLKSADFCVAQYGLTKPLISDITPSNVAKFMDNSTNAKPILRPLSDLTKEIEVNGEKFIPIEKLAEIDEVVVLQYSFEFFETSIKYLPHWIVEQLFKWHFDVYGLIENNLAIDINTLKL